MIRDQYFFLIFWSLFYLIINKQDKQVRFSSIQEKLTVYLAVNSSNNISKTPLPTPKLTPVQIITPKPPTLLTTSKLTPITKLTTPPALKETVKEDDQGITFQIAFNKFIEFLKVTKKNFDAWLESNTLEPQTTLNIIWLCLFILFITFCCLCCRYCCAKKEEKKELKDKLDLKRDHLFGPNYAERIQPKVEEIDYNIESTMFDALAEIKLGQIRFSLDFNTEENIVEITVHEGKDIPAADISGFSDPYVKVLLKPAGKKEYKTKTKKSTLSPSYEETFFMKNVTYANFTTSTLTLKVYDHNRFGPHELLGEANIPINDIDLSKGKITEWRIIMPEFKSEVGKFGKDFKLGHICIGLGYAPNTSVLAIFVLSCYKIKAVDESGSSDPYVTFFLIQDGRKVKKRKTTVKLRTLNPSFNESFAFEVNFEKIEETSLMFVLADYDKGQPGEPIGQTIIGPLGQGLGIKHWEQVRRSPGKPICYWHMLKPVPVAE
ncbi:synaptotagmin-1 [Hydra vulgaris]|uniref:synaptotagmin-1 n=1 Tax=Hydra vulgaris TaxID=6087 RepID=UPI001F5FE0E0|nr:synaptotagmin-1 [Hydra vulgaris]